MCALCGPVSECWCGDVAGVWSTNLESILRVLAEQNLRRIAHDLAPLIEELAAHELQHIH